MSNQQQRFSPIDELCAPDEPTPAPECFELPWPVSWTLPLVFVAGIVVGFIARGWL